MKLLVALFLLIQQPTQVVTLTGEVTEADTTPPTPIENARVELSVGETPSRIVRTDAHGRYEITGIQPGQYRLKVMADGFAAADFGQPAPNTPGVTLSVGAGSTPDPISFQLVRAGTITGRVFDIDSEPLAGAIVLVSKAVSGPNGRRVAPAGFTRTDDRGEYRLYWLTPDEYYVSASYTAARLGPLFVPPNNNILPPPNGYEPTFYRNAPDLASTERIQLKPGEQRSAVDFRLMRLPTVNISGTVTDGKTGRGVSAQLLLSGSSEIPGGLSFQGQSDVTGKYELRDIASGNYRVLVQTDLAAPPVIKTLEVATVDIPNFNIVLEPGFSIKGRVVTDDGAPLPPLGRTNIILNGNTGSGSARLQASGEFEISNLQKGNYTLFSSNWPEDYYLKSATLGRADPLNGPVALSGEDQNSLELVISSGTGRVNGTITGARRTAQVVLVPEEKLRDKTALYKTTATDQAGRFSFRGIPPGDYLIFAWDYMEQGAFYNRDFLKSYEIKAAPVHIEPRSESTVSMEVIPRQQ